MSEERRSTRFALLAVLFLVGGLHVLSAGVPDIFDELPGQYAATAWEMVGSGVWLIPTLDGIPRLQKPPLVYWLTASSLSLLGRNEFAARLPTAFALVGLLLVTYALGAQLYGPSRGVVAAGILGTSFGMVALGKLIMPEPFLALGIVLTLFAVVRAVEDPERRRWWVLAAWGAAALGSLSKGLHGFLLPAAVVALVTALSPASRRPLAALACPHGPALFLALVLPWPLYVESRFPGYLADNFFNEQLGHLFDTHFPRDSEPAPLGLLWAQHLVWWFPWLLFAGAAVLNRPAGRAHPLAALPAVWFWTTVVVASLWGQRQDYHTMLAWPAFALLLSRAWDVGSDGRGVRLALRIPLLALLALGALGFLAYGLSAVASPSTAGTSAPFGARNSVLGAITGVAGDEWRRLRPLLLPAAAGLVLGAGGGFALLRRPETRGQSWLPVAAGMMGPLVAALVGLQAFAPFFGLKAIAAALEREAGRTALVVYDGPSHRASSLCFYTDVPVLWLALPETEFAVRSAGVGRDRFVAESEVIERWRSGQPIWLITEESRIERWRARLGGDATPIVARSGTRILVGNRTARADHPRASR